MTTPPHRVEVLGYGAYGTVYLAQGYVLKKMFLPSASYQRSFLDEAKAWNDLSKEEGLAPYLPKFCWSKIHKNYGYICSVYEYVKPLDVYLAEHGPLSFERGYGIFRHLAHAFELLYRAGYVHRDIKPGNILIRILPASDPLAFVPIIIDFGFACKMPCEDRHLVGTPGFVPDNWVGPEARRKWGLYSDLSGSRHAFGKLGEAPQGAPKNRFRTLKTQRNIIRPRYSPTTDSYSLAKTLSYVYVSTNWGDNQEQREHAYELIQGYKTPVIGELAAAMARAKLGIEEDNVRPTTAAAEAAAEALGHRSFFLPDMPGEKAASAASATRKRKRGNNNNNNAMGANKRSKENNDGNAGKK